MTVSDGYVISCSVPATFDGVKLLATQTYVQETGTPVQQLCMYVPQNNDFQVNAHYPSLADGAGYQAEFYYKADRSVADDDPSTVSYAVSVDADPDNAGATMSTFVIPASDNAEAGSYWWRVDLVDPDGDRSTTGYGVLMVEAVLWHRVRNTRICRSSYSGTGPRALGRLSYTGAFPVTSTPASQPCRSTSPRVWSKGCARTSTGMRPGAGRGTRPVKKRSGRPPENSAIWV